MGFLDGFYENLHQLTQYQQMTDRAQSNVGNDPGLSQRMGNYQSRYWWMDPGAIWSMAKAGIEADHPAAQQAASAAGAIKGQSGLGFGSVGQPVTGGVPDLSQIAPQLEQSSAPKPTVNAMAYHAPISPVQSLFGKGQHTGLLSALNNMPMSKWDTLPPDVQQQLSNLSFQKVDPSEIPNFNPNDTQRSPVVGAYEIQGADQLSPEASTALSNAIRSQGGATYGPLNFKQGAYQQDPTLAARYGSKNIMTIGGQHADMGGVGVGGITAQGLPGIPDVSPMASKGVQVGLMAAAAPLQEVQGQVRNLYQLGVNQQAPQWTQSQSDLGIAAGQLMRGEHVDIGNGLLGAAPDSEVVQERQRRERERGQIAGHSVTLGRAIASVADAATGHTVLEPGAIPYQILSGLVDAAVAVKADPTARALGGIGTEAELFRDAGSVGKAVQAFRETGAITPALQAFHDAGGITGLRGAINQEAVDKWLTGTDGQHVVNQIANTADASTIWRKLGKQVPPALAADLADTADPGEVTDKLRNVLGPIVRHQPDVGAFTQGFPGSNLDDALVMRNAQSRWTAMMPHQAVSGLDPTANVVELERASAALKMRDQFPAWFDQMARAPGASERQNVWEQVAKDAQNKLVDSGVARQRARELTEFGQRSRALDTAYSTQAIKDGATGGPLIIDGVPKLDTVQSPTFLGQTLNDDIALPDWRGIRRQLSDPRVRYALNNPAIKSAEKVLDTGQTVWKGLQIATVKTMAKVLGDEQLGMAARGYDSLANHPIHALGMILATPMAELPEDAGFLQRVRYATSKDLRWGAEKIPGVEPALLNTMQGHSFDTLDDIRQIASHGIDTTVQDKGQVLASRWRAIYQGQNGVSPEEFLDAHTRNLAQYAASPDTSRFAQAESLKAAQDAYWDGDLKDLRLKFADRTKNDMLAADQATSDAYVAKTMNQMQVVTGGHPELMDAIATGKLGDTPIWAHRPDGTPQITRNYVSKLADYQDHFPIGTIQEKAIYGRDAVKDGMLSRAFHILMGTPSAVLSKSPLYRQAYWETAADNAPFMDEAAQATLRANAEAANLPADLAKGLERGLAQGTGQLSIDQADRIAQGRALDIVQRTTHEFSNRSQLFDQLRLLTPFGEVWRKTMLRWANIIKENPQTVRRLQQGLIEARSGELGDVLAGPGHIAGEGFFHKDQYGQEVFTVPFSGFATQHIPLPTGGMTNHLGPIPTGPIPVPEFKPTNVPVPLAGNVMGLSVGTEMFPALGPVMSLPAAWLVQQVHASPTITNALFPYGPPKDSADLFNYAPSWLRTAFGHDRTTNLDSPRVFANNVKSVLAYGISTGEYKTGTPADISKAVEDATQKAHQLYFLQGASQFFVPGAPSQQFLVKDKGGHLVDLSLLIKAYNDLSDPHVTTDGQPGNVNTASDRFVQKYGTDLLKTVTAKSYSYVFGVPTDPNAAKWVDQNPNVRRDFPLLYGYFAPPSDPNNFDYATYQQQFSRGERKAVSPEQWLHLGNARLASIQYGQARDQVDALNKGKTPTAAQRQWLAKVKQNLMDEFPGYSDALYGGEGLPQRPDVKELVRQATQAANDPTVKKTNAGAGLAIYIQARQQADAAWMKADKTHGSGGWTTASSAYSVSLRDWLRKVATNLIGTEQNPGPNSQFGPLFESVFQREMKDDTNPSDPTGGTGG